MKKILLCITGASGVIYGKVFIEEALKLGVKVDCIVSDNAKKVLEYELEISYENFERNYKSYGVNFFSPSDFSVKVASGSYLRKFYQGVIVLPCSVGTLGAVANGIVLNLIHRVCDVALKERIPLILAVREMPLNSIHLRNMLRLSNMGAIVFPISPAFYHKPKTLADLIKFVVGKIFDLLEIEHNLYKRWQGS
jgi:4-hydroxy-3-polyprenylbenzoate decarboxylase